MCTNNTRLSKKVMKKKTVLTKQDNISETEGLPNSEIVSSTDDNALKDALSSKIEEQENDSVCDKESNLQENEGDPNNIGNIIAGDKNQENKITVEDETILKAVSISESSSDFEQQADIEPKESMRCYMQTTGRNFVIGQACTGIKHLNANPPLPCQDSIAFSLKPRPILIVCDGAGSSKLSEIGSQALVSGISRLLQSSEPLLKHTLDDRQENNLTIEKWVRIIIRHSVGILEDLALQHRRDLRDFRATLNLAIVGEVHTLWVRVGDGEIVQERINYLSDKPEELNYDLVCVGEEMKGEFANQTQFIDNSLTFDKVSWGILDSKETVGIALMSDGASERLVSAQRNKVATRIIKWLSELRSEKLTAGMLTQAFYSEDFCKRSSGDDRSIVLWASEYAI